MFVSLEGSALTRDDDDENNGDDLKEDDGIYKFTLIPTFIDMLIKGAPITLFTLSADPIALPIFLI